MISLQKDTKLCFDGGKVALKMGLARMLIEWQGSPTFSSILYDYKFVHLLLNAQFSDQDILGNNFDKKKMKFVKGKREENWILFLIISLRTFT